MLAQDRKENAVLYYEPASEDVEKVHLSSARVRLAGGGNGCESAGSRVVTERGMLRIEDVRVGDRVPSRNGMTWKSVISTYRSPAPVAVFEVVTKRGLRFIGSGDHMSWVADATPRGWQGGIDPNTSTRCWRYLRDMAGAVLDDGLFIAVRGNGLWPKSCEIDADDAYFLGLLVGDGSYNGKGYNRGTGSISCDAQDPEIPEWICAYLASKGVVARPGPRSGAVHVQWSSVAFWDWLKSIGLEKAKGEHKSIPEAVWLGTREVVAAFIRGFADSDGCATTKPSVVIVNTSEDLARGAQIMLKRLGIKSSLHLQKVAPGSKSTLDIWRLEVTGSALALYRDRVGFMCRRKSSRLPDRKSTKWPKSHHGWDRVRSVRCVGEDYVYGLTIDGEPLYFSNGFLQHNSSKSETGLVEIVSMVTGIIPQSLREKYPEHNWKKRLRGPCRARIVCQSITNTLQPIILPKLRWNCWTGTDEPGGRRGHWGWIPKMSLIDGDWSKSWSEKYRMLRVLYRNPDNLDEVVGESTIQFQSYDVDAADQESGDLHCVLLDEPPPHAIYRANEARTMRVAGWIMLAMTWPDTPQINVDWLFDEIYERGIPGPNKRDDYECFRLRTTQNQFLMQEAVQKQIAAWDSRMVAARIEGQPIRFSNRVHELFTDVTDEWCFSCGERRPLADGHCLICKSSDVVTFRHVMDFEYKRGWPVIWVVDPHPRKAHMSLYVTVTPNDDWWVVAELECKGDPTDMRILCDEVESQLGLRVVRRLIDPRMGGSVSGAQRDRTWQDEFDAAGLYCDAGVITKEADIGRDPINTMLRPDPYTRMPRLLFHPRCVNAIQQFKRFMWDDQKDTVDRGQKQKAKDKNDDYPACLRYFALEEPSFDALLHGGRLIQARSVGRRSPSSWRRRTG